MHVNITFVQIHLNNLINIYMFISFDVTCVQYNNIFIIFTGIFRYTGILLYFDNIFSACIYMYMSKCGYIYCLYVSENDI